jgi:hypothetical protein
MINIILVVGLTMMPPVGVVVVVVVGSSVVNVCCWDGVWKK